jgi:hypothetical protein
LLDLTLHGGSWDFVSCRYKRSYKECSDMASDMRKLLPVEFSVELFCAPHKV